MSIAYTYILWTYFNHGSLYIILLLHIILSHIICVYRFCDIPENIDVLVTHGPAYGRLDAVILGDAHPRAGKGLGLLKEEKWGSKVSFFAYTNLRFIQLLIHIRPNKGPGGGYKSGSALSTPPRPCTRCQRRYSGLRSLTLYRQFRAMWPGWEGIVIMRTCSKRYTNILKYGCCCGRGYR